MTEGEARQSVVDACRAMNALGINQGTSGIISRESIVHKLGHRLVKRILVDSGFSLNKLLSYWRGLII